MSFLIRCDIDVRCFVGFAHLHLLTIDGCILGIDLRHATGVVNDSHYGIGWHFCHLFTCVEILIFLTDINIILILVPLHEDGVSIHILIAFVRKLKHLHRIPIDGVIDDWHFQFAKSTVRHTHLRHRNGGIGTIMEKLLDTILVLLPLPCLCRQRVHWHRFVICVGCIEER